MLKIAICDDDLRFAGSLETLVMAENRELGIRVETEVFADGKTLVEHIQAGERYGLIFLDIEMKHVDGISAARLIRETDRSVLFIYISGYDSYLKELFEVEPFRFLSKPLEKELFAATIRRRASGLEKRKFSISSHLTRKSEKFR